MIFNKLDFQNDKLLYRQLADTIEEKITSNEIEVGQRIPPERELCKTFSVSLPTVRKAMSKLVEEGYLVRRNNYGTFVINSKPQKGMDLKKKNEICLICCPYSEIRKDKRYIADIGESASPTYQNFVRGVEEKTREIGAYLIFCVLNKGELSLEEKEKDIAGVILSGEITPEYFRKVKKLGIPFILSGDMHQKTRTDASVDVIASNDFQAGYIAVKHLTDLGHKKIAYLMQKGEYPWVIDTQNGFMEAIKEANAYCDKELQVKPDGWNIEDGYNAAKELLSRSVPFTGMVCSGSRYWVGALKALSEKGIKVPEDISIVNIGLAYELTRVAFSSMEMGRAAVESLVKRIKNPDMPPERVIIEPHLIEGNSARHLG